MHFRAKKSNLPRSKLILTGRDGEEDKELEEKYQEEEKPKEKKVF